MMSEISSASSPLNIYEEELNEHTTLDWSCKNLETVPEINNNLLCVLYLQNNKLETLPDDLFPSLPNLMYLDLRDNRLTDLPRSIKNHHCLTHLLLQNNCLTSLPDELGTVINLKVLQINGNPLMYPPREVIKEGVSKILKFLHDKFIDTLFLQPQTDSVINSSRSSDILISTQSRIYNSIIDETIKNKNNLLIKFNEKVDDSDDEIYYDKIKGKCPKLDKSRHKSIPSYYQSAKYLKPWIVEGRKAKDEKIKQNYLKDLAIKKHKDLLATRENILQERKTLEQLRSWRTDYRHRQFFRNSSYRLDPAQYPYDTSPEYMTLLSREDIEKDLPDKFRRSLLRRSRPTVPRKSTNDVHLAMKIKQLFQNLEAIDLRRDGMTPRTEQRVLLNEIQKISEIKQKLNELSTANQKSLSLE